MILFFNYIIPNPFYMKMHGNTIIFILYACCPWWHHECFSLSSISRNGEVTKRNPYIL
ncbi:MAG: hypothetical protein XE11_2232 [Methanomicrobiales archaeon 53_19]|nr:MAG: hypothetical protein XD88_1642 [Methanocalculus sp. 52_23]KUL01109.1 MAG: hypothetical protein XE11_2232 [Methanomicrobiales archaeon 53_19]